MPKNPFDNININEILAEYNKFRSPEVTVIHVVSMIILKISYMK
jgi:hypothetical protein